MWPFQVSSSEHISTTSRNSSLASESSLISESAGVSAGVATWHRFFFPLSCWYKNLLTIFKYGVKSMFFAIGSQIAVPGDSSRILSSTICSARICSIAFASHQQFCTGSHSVSSTASTSSSLC
eukprot:g64969.t1